MTAVPANIVRRQVNIDFASAKSSGWHARRSDAEVFFNLISYTFPVGEKFFIQAVKRHQDRITDPLLQRQVEDFIYQETMHAKEHLRCNLVLDRSCSYGPKVARLATALLKVSRRIYPKSTQLALSCAIEHFTSTFADHLLRRQRAFIAAADPPFAALWLWHAVEETEHKAVCLDLYRHVVGRGPVAYLHRVAVMVLATLIFLAIMLVGTLWARPRTGGARRGAGSAPSPGPGSREDKPAREFSLSGVLTELVHLKLYLDYYRPGFEPWDHDNRHLIEEWKERFKGFGDRAAAAAAATAREREMA